MINITIYVRLILSGKKLYNSDNSEKIESTEKNRVDKIIVVMRTSFTIRLLNNYELGVGP